MSLEPTGMSVTPSVGDHIHATTTFEHAWATPGHTATGGSQKSKELFFNLELATRKRKNKSLIIELVTRSVTFYF